MGPQPISLCAELDAPHQCIALGDLPLEGGGCIRDCTLSYVTHGTLDRSAGNAILVLPSIGGTHHRHDFLIGLGKALDPEKFFIVAVDTLGNGLSTSPSNSEDQPGGNFPVFSVRDIVSSQYQLMLALGISKWSAVCGASFGGMQALQWAVSHPRSVDALIALTPLARTPAWSVLVNEATRLALLADPAWDGTDFAAAPTRGWRVWAAIMRVLVTRTPQALAHAFPVASSVTSAIARLGQESIDASPNPWDWIRQTQAYDAHDIGSTRGFDGDVENALASIRARCLVAAPPLDLYNPVEEVRAIATGIKNCVFVEIPSIEGHLSASAVDPNAAHFLNATIAAFLSEKLPQAA